MEDKHWPNLATLFFARAAEQGDKPFFRQEDGGYWHVTGWTDTHTSPEK